MAYFKEIVTKAIIGKAKKTTTLDHEILVEDNINKAILSMLLLNL